MIRRPVDMRRFILLSAGALALVATPGCGSSDRATVIGKLVRSDGSPLVGARVIATSQETGKSAYATTDREGEFSLGIAEEGDGIPPGNYQLIIVEDLGDADNRRRPSVAAKYRNPETSQIQFSVEAGQKIELNQTLDPPK